MTEIKSREVVLKQSSKQTFEFLVDLNNFARLLPEERIENLETDATTCNFDIKGMAHIGLKVDSKEANKQIHLIPDGKAPFDFTLDIVIDEDSNGSKAQLLFNADINPFMKAMVTKPLTNFFNMLADKLEELDF